MSGSHGTNGGRARCLRPAWTRWGFRQVVAQPAAAHEQRLGRPGALHLDQVVVVLQSTATGAWPSRSAMAEAATDRLAGVTGQVVASALRSWRTSASAVAWGSS